MTNLVRKFIKGLSPLGRDQRGITGLETAIVLIAFVVVSSVFAVAALGTDQTFTLEVIPPSGAVLFIQRTTPISLELVTNLD